MLCLLHKKEDKTDCSIYTGISRSSTTHNILSNILLSRITPNAEDIIRVNQCGFRSSRSTTDRIFCIRQILTYSMVQSPSSEANWFAASQEIPRISRNPKVHYRTHKRPPPVSILGQPNSVHIPISHLLEIHLPPFQ